MSVFDGFFSETQWNKIIVASAMIDKFITINPHLLGLNLGLQVSPDDKVWWSFVPVWWSVGPYRLLLCDRHSPSSRLR